jgi:hypothetical protein
MGTVWEDAPVVKQIAESLIEKYFDETIRYHNPSIKYLFKDSKKSKDLGKCSKSTGFWRHLAEFDYIIWIFKSFWDDATPVEREALVFHELKHILIEEDDETGELNFKIAPHNIEAFVEEVQIYNDWRIELSEMKKAFE